MSNPPDELELLVVQATWLATDVIGLRLESAQRHDLPSWHPGAHIDVHLPSGLVRPFSLCGDTSDRTGYQVAVLRESNGRGGSAEVHETQLVGRTLRVTGPKNHFPMVAAAHHLLLAGGIGITPLKVMADEAARTSASWALHYGGRTLTSMAFHDELRRLHGDRVHLVPEDQSGLLDLDGLIAGAAPGTAVYCCGPAAMIRRAREVATGRDDITFHFEQFVAAPDAVPPDTTPSSGAFEVVLCRSGMTLTVLPGQSILETVRAAGVEVESSCEDGFCGTCETRVISGVPEHHDTVLTEDERARNDTMMICVGRAAPGSRLEIDR